MQETEKTAWTPYRTPSRDELFAKFDRPYGTSKHLLILYSLVIGIKAKVIIELGLGETTGALRAAALETGGTLYTCDYDKRRFAYALPEQDAQWRLFLEPSASFLQKVPEPIDLVMHDAAHDYLGVKRDLEAIIPKMRQFGIVCVHDSQQINHGRDTLGAIRDATKKFSVSITNLPFNAGLAIIRVESSNHSSIDPSSGTFKGEIETELLEFPTIPCDERIPVTPGRNLFLAAKIKLGHILRQAGLRS